MILKILLVIGVIAVVYFAFFKKKPVTAKENKKENKPQPNDMIECATCGVYVDVSEAILSSGKYYCSQECQNKDK